MAVSVSSIDGSCEILCMDIGGDQAEVCSCLEIWLVLYTVVI